MNIKILGIGTALPPISVPQADAGGWLAHALRHEPKAARLARLIHHASGIETRHTCTELFCLPPEQSPLALGIAPESSAPTSQRMEIYEQESTKLAVQAAQNALAGWAQERGISVHEAREAITHVIAISCTGFFAPGLDYVVARELGLSMRVKRLMIGFMGCAATFNGLRTAHEIVQGQPDAHVLVISVELCTLHCQPSTAPEDIVAASLFADGAAAAVVGAAEAGGLYSLEAFHSDVKPQTEDLMAWRIRDHGYVLNLSPEIPRHLGQAATSGLQALFGDDRPELWAIHPGGRAIVDALVEVFDLDDDEIAPTRRTLRDYGNMSSATIMFVLKAAHEQLRTQRSGPVSGVAMAFGPGLTVEMSRLSYVPG